MGLTIMSNEDESTQYGIDVSHHNGKINWFTVATSNEPKIDFVFMKATQGVGYVDTALFYNAHQAQDAGLKTSYYHFATLNSHEEEIDARAEAKFFLSVLAKLPKNYLPLVLDIEENKTQLDKHEVLNWINSFFYEMSKGGYNDLYIYSYSSFLQSNLPLHHNLNNKLWLAGYVRESKLIIPAGWTEYDIWQYSAQGEINGINGNVDLNITKHLI